MSGNTFTWLNKDGKWHWYYLKPKHWTMKFWFWRANKALDKTEAIFTQWSKNLAELKEKSNNISTGQEENLSE